jgi:coenzyme F420-reducing hydrogenase alpha subunit
MKGKAASASIASPVSQTKTLAGTVKSRPPASSARSSHPSPKVRNELIKVNPLARVEGEGALCIKIRKNQITELQFRIMEPPRFFEAFLRGRDFREAPDMTARICGICPVAHQLSSAQAMERALGLVIPAPLRNLRRVLYCGEWIESHVLHILMLHAPDFLGYADVIQMAKDHLGIIQLGIRIKQIGNAIVTLLGGREIHPINVRVGGFYRIPSPRELAPLIEDLKWAREQAIDLVKWCADLPIPEFEDDYEFVSLRHPDQYPLNDGRLVSNRGLEIDLSEYEHHFLEEQVEHSTSLHSRLKERGVYLVGPLARYNLNYDRLSPLVRETAAAVHFPRATRNPFSSIVVRALETLYACDEALLILERDDLPEHPAVPVEPQAAIGFGGTEAPRGILYHRYRLNREGLIEEAKIIPPTSQNQKVIERDLYRFVEKNMALPKDRLTWQCEQIVRNYDPCISCSCHFLRLTLTKS